MNVTSTHAECAVGHQWAATFKHGERIIMHGGKAPTKGHRWVVTPENCPTCGHRWMRGRTDPVENKQ